MEQKYLGSFKIWFLKQMEMMKGLQKVTNEEVLENIGKKRTHLNNILHRKTN
jgi:hypothetical protein